jgi:hypothetical protein
MKTIKILIISIVFDIILFYNSKRKIEYPEKLMRRHNNKIDNSNKKIYSLIAVSLLIISSDINK